MKRTAKQSRDLVFEVIQEIRKNKRVSRKLIAETCKKYKIKESHIVSVGKWEYFYTL
jgi:hypothetical protein